MRLPPPRHFTLPSCLPSSGREERRRGIRGRGAWPLPHSRAGLSKQPGCGQQAGRAPLRLDRAAGEARPARGRVLTRWGRAGSGRLHTGDTALHSRPPRGRPHWAERRDRPMILCSRCCHRAKNTCTAHTRRRLRRAPSAKSAGRGPGSGSARATAPHRCRTWLQLCGSLRSWRHGLPPPPPSRSLPSRLRRGQTPTRGPRAPRRSLPGPGQLLQSSRMRAGDALAARQGRGRQALA